MRIVYCALDQRVPGTTGGSVHVSAVAEGLASLGHEVSVLATRGAGPAPAGRARYHSLAPPLGVRHLRLLRAGAVRTFARRANADVVIERYHNFGGEGVRAARAIGAAAVLEVNAPIIDYPGSWKARLDKAALVEPMRRWRDWQCRHADLIVTPAAEVLPPFVPRARILETEWGADTDAFAPGASGPVPFARRRGAVLAVFAGAFRPWHGAVHLVRAVRQLRLEGQLDIDAVLVGEGPELAPARKEAAGLDGVTFTGPVAHAEMPACLAAADLGVAPFDVAAHPPLQLGFYWSPLKVFEYMASGLPVVAPAIPRLAGILGPDLASGLYDPNAPRGLADALLRLAANRSERERMGKVGRERACREFSWSAHCRRLEEAIAPLARRRTA
ncbi:MAG TPA: glycosyltransferase [Vicinamibacterales bacterium]|nr:glycosyltransferase [Vicinamibacterales bacterium]